MTTLQYAFCMVYAILSIGLMAIIAVQKGQDRNALGALSGNTMDTYYSQNIKNTPEAFKKRMTKILGVCWVLMNGIGLLVF